MRWWLAAGLVVGLLMPLSAFPCDQHPIPSNDRGLIRVEPLENSGLYGFWFDTDMDGYPDMALIYQMDRDGDYSRFPLFYYEGVDRAGLAEEVWEDRAGLAHCFDFVLYYKRTVRQ